MVRGERLNVVSTRQQRIKWQMDTLDDHRGELEGARRPCCIRVYGQGA